MTQTDAIVELVRSVMRSDVIGTYLHGSAVFGGLKPRSDLHVFALTTRTATLDERRALVAGLLPISGRSSPYRRPVELTIAVESDLCPWRYPPTVDFQYGEWLRAGFEAGGVPAAEPGPDLAVLVTMVLAADRPLSGPPPAAVLDAVPVEDLSRSCMDGIPGLVADLEPDTRNVLLTFARIWTTVATGTVRSKDAAADWALERLPAAHRGVLVRARDGYLGEADERWDDRMPDVRAHVAHVRREIERATAERG